MGELLPYVKYIIAVYGWALWIIILDYKFSNCVLQLGITNLRNKLRGNLNSGNMLLARVVYNIPSPLSFVASYGIHEGNEEVLF